MQQAEARSPEEPRSSGATDPATEKCSSPIRDGTGNKQPGDACDCGPLVEAAALEVTGLGHRLSCRHRYAGSTALQRSKNTCCGSLAATWGQPAPCFHSTVCFGDMCSDCRDAVRCIDGRGSKLGVNWHVQARQRALGICTAGVLGLHNVWSPEILGGDGLICSATAKTCKPAVGAECKRPIRIAGLNKEGTTTPAAEPKPCLTPK